MARPSDDILTSTGMEARKPQGSVRLIACGALAREILALTAANGWTHMDLQCLPAIYHNHPEKIAPAVEAAVNDARSAGYKDIFVVYADCGTGGGLERLCQSLDVGLVPGPHCYSFFDGNDAFAARAEDEMTSFYLTDFLVRQFDAFVWKPLGLDRHPKLRDMYFAHYERLIYLAQVDDAALTEKAALCAKKLGLTFERRVTGYGDLPNVLGQYQR